jgi:hypothetical protein
MELHDDKNGVKDRILDDLSKSIKLVRRTLLCVYFSYNPWVLWSWYETITEFCSKHRSYGVLKSDLVYKCSIINVLGLT